MMKGVNKTTDYKAKQFIKDGQYLRLDVVIKEEKYANMTDATAETRNYLVGAVDAQVIQNSDIQTKIKDFVNLIK